MQTVVSSENAPKAVGPYSQAISAGAWVFTSGQIALDPATGALVPGDIAAETRQVMANLQAVLAAAGVGFDRVIKSTVYLRDMSDFAAFNDVYGRHFSAMPPARSTVGVAALPLGARVEVDMVALAECQTSAAG